MPWKREPVSRRWRWPNLTDELDEVISGCQSLLNPRPTS